MPHALHLLVVCCLLRTFMWKSFQLHVIEIRQCQLAVAISEGGPASVPSATERNKLKTRSRYTFLYAHTHKYIRTTQTNIVLFCLSLLYW